MYCLRQAGRECRNVHSVLKIIGFETYNVQGLEKCPVIIFFHKHNECMYRIHQYLQFWLTYWYMYSLAGGAGVRAFTYLAEGWVLKYQLLKNLSRKDGQRQLHGQILDNRCECHGSSEVTIVNGCPVSKQVLHSKEPTLLTALNA